ncbi:pH-response regulator protein palF/Rim8p [[Candida] anglica]|uniref:pH-response regulator protein palF/RIM8 n=1 Tax=[Candida] anglica TaxID=148631 RepID=A0ABP0E8J0_9ASCO
MRRAVSRIIPSRQQRNQKLGAQPQRSPLDSALTSTNAPSNGNPNFKIDFNSVADFYITLDDPHKSWLPGDEVSGQIILISRKNLVDISITLSLGGCVKINASSHSKMRPIKHTLFNHTIKIYGEEQTDDDYGDPEHGNASSNEFQNGLYKGEHRFPFIVKLPNKRVFTSIEFGKGSIVYSLKASLGSIQTPSSRSDSPSSTGTNNSSPQDSTHVVGGINFIAKAKSLKNLHNPTYTSEKLINLINPIDVAKLPPAKAKQLIIKNPKYNRKLSRTLSSTSTVNTFSTMSSNNSEGAAGTDSTTFPLTENTAVQSGGTNLPPVTPISEHSATTATTGGQQYKRENIRVSLEIPERGYLRGELIPIKINISHLKMIQDSNGIIITFVRVCRLDNGPDSLFESFRKDLQQSIIPLYVDPTTFQSEINTSVRVPADAFPTISGCPLVSFQYFIEVLVNLSGKSLPIDGVEQSKSNNATTPDTTSGSFNFNFGNKAPYNQKELSTFINTDKYKRMKKFLQITTEVIIGTHRSKEKKPAALLQDETNSVSPISRRSSLVSSNISQVADVVPLEVPKTLSPSSHLSTGEGSANAAPASISAPMATVNIGTPPYADAPDYHEFSPSGSESLLPVPNQSRLSEKDQMRLREASLMPSAPPLDDIEEDIGGVSPVDRNDDILQHVSEEGEQGEDSYSVHNVEPQEVSEATGGQEYSFFTYDNLEHNNVSNIEQDQYSEIDFVPHYDSVNNDTLLTTEPHTNGEGMDSSNTSITTHNIPSNQETLNGVGNVSAASLQR